ncbi:DUF6286 domain-containing protein [Herbidospora mongoliensis]|uniref:DUF6286 domain-containing protein n=1 Tax=Herbidospora mongoliensis TaxID=688067 RepID=UPI00082B3C23|nr:DUF6286 domain-containing protein [Herbidospora mongoliensis]
MTTLHAGAGSPEPRQITGETPEPPSRASARGKGAARFLRPKRKVPAAIAALVLFATGLLIAMETISALFGHPGRIVPYDRVADWARATTWQDNAVMAGAGAIGIVGILLILIGTVPGRPRLVALRSHDPNMIISTPRRMLARVLGAVAAQVDGVRQARAQVRGRRVTVHAGTDLRDTAALRERVRDAVEDELAKLAPVGRYTVKTRVRGAR